MFKSIIVRFLGWIESHRALITVLTAFLFFWQLVHLFWLTFDVVALRLLGKSFFELSIFPKLLIIFVDYTEVPVLISATLLYISYLHAGFNWRSVWFIFFLNTQWFHIFWITDEFVVSRFSYTGHEIFPVWLAWVAIFIDYLEVPVIFDTVKDSWKIVLNNFKPSVVK